MDLAAYAAELNQKVVTLDEQILSLNEQITGLTERQAVVQDVLAQTKIRFELDLSGRPGDLYFWGEYGTSNLTDWSKVDDLAAGEQIFLVDLTSITLAGDWRDEFRINQRLLFKRPGNAPQFGLVSTVGYVAGETTVDIIGDQLDPAIFVVSEELYRFNGPGWDNDPDLLGQMSAFESFYDFLHHPVGLDGSYGIIDTKNRVNTALNLFQLDRAKIAATAAGLNGFLP